LTFYQDTMKKGLYKLGFKMPPTYHSKCCFSFSFKRNVKQEVVNFRVGIEA